MFFFPVSVNMNKHWNALNKKYKSFHTEESSYTDWSSRSVWANKMRGCMETVVENVVSTLYILQLSEHNQVVQEYSMPIVPADVLNAGVYLFILLVFLFQPWSH